MSHSPALTHALSFFPTKNGELLIGGHPVGELAEQYGTPLYIYDLAIARRKAAKLAHAFGERFELHYAIKANPRPEVISCFRDLSFGFDVASLMELETALSVDVDPTTVGFAGPGKSDRELEYAINIGLGQINCESEGELKRIAVIADRLSKPANVALRLNPPNQVKQSGMRMGGGASQFGVDTEQAPALLKQIGELPQINFVGFHIYAGSQNLKVDPLVANFDACLNVLAELWPHCPTRPKVVNLGGGFGIPYTQKDVALDIDAVGDAAQSLVTQQGERLEDVQLVLESGRYLVGESGLYVCRVRDRKVSRDHTFVITDGGLHHHLAATGNFGQVIHRPYPVAAVQKLDQAADEVVAVVGPLCTPLDTFGKKLPMPPVTRGDLVAVFASGAYGFTASPRGFLSHPEPAQVVVDSD